MMMLIGMRSIKTITITMMIECGDVNCSTLASADDDEMVFPNSLKAANHLPRLLPIPARALSHPNMHNIC